MGGRTGNLRSHLKCLGDRYAREPKQARFPITSEQAPWEVPYEKYAPDTFTTAKILGTGSGKAPAWADANIENAATAQTFKWNKLDGAINRASYEKEYGFDGLLPRNPVGRTGLRGRGCLGRWGPNHAADPIVTKWKRKSNGAIAADKKSSKPILQMVAIKRHDTGEWALPGGMVDAGEDVSLTLKREFSEEALNSLELSTDQTAEAREGLHRLFRSPDEVYRGYVDDPRNTDNAWMETVACNFHDEDGKTTEHFRLNAGDDAVGVKWTDIKSELKLYASHSEFIEKVAKLRGAHW